MPDPRQKTLQELVNRLLGKCVVTPDGCWEYQGHRNEAGYCQVTLNGDRHMAHRFIYAAFAGHPVPDGFDVCHRCHNPACINPFHIRTDSHHSNLVESSQAKRLNGQQKTHCKRGHPLSGGNLLKGYGRYCAICSRGRYRLRRGWPEDLAFDPSIPIIPHGYKLDFETREIVPAVK